MKGRFELQVGLRYLRAHGVNRFVSFISLISMLGIAVGVAVLITVLSVVNGFERELRGRILAMTSHAAIEAMEGGIQDWSHAAELALAKPAVRAAAPYVAGEGMLAAGELLSGVVVRGVLPDREADVSGVPGALRQGSLDSLVGGEYRIVVGSELASALGVGLGDRVILVIPQGSVTPAGFLPRMRRFVISGVFEVGMFEYDRHLAFIHMGDAQALYRLGDHVSGIRLQLHDMFLAPEVVRVVAADLGGGYYISDWTRQHRNFFRSIQITKRMMFVILLLIVGVAVFNIVSTLVMVVKDKEGDIAILRALGTAPRSIMAIFIIQGSLIGVLGTLGGLLLGVLLTSQLEQLILWLERLMDTDLLAADVYFISDLPAQLLWSDVAGICGVALILALGSTLYPAWRAARTQPAEVLRYE